MKKLGFLLSLSVSLLLLGAQVAFAKTVICHVPPDDPSNYHTISVGDAAVPAHLAHGDCLGPCPTCGCGFTPAEISDVNCVGGTFCQSTADACQFFCLGPPICACEPGDTQCCQGNPCCENCPGVGGPGCEAFNVTTCGCEPEECCFTLGCP